LAFPHYPVEDCLDELSRQLAVCSDVVLQAPPGAGKTTLVPLALLDQPWLARQKILVLEPRRIAARSAAYRMAQLLGEKPGQTVGYRMRLDTKVGRDTRIEVITEGILTRMLQQDPALEGVGLVIFDEFHERSLDSDLALALCLKGRELFGDDRGNATSLKLLVMSATLDNTGLARVLGDPPVVTSDGRMHPVDIIYGAAAQTGEVIVERIVKTIRQALLDNPDSSILAFLPGQGEIHRVADALDEWLVERKIRDVQLRPLYGNLTLAEQQQAIAPCGQPGERKVVLATNIAETSLTIDGIDVVVDSGLAREPGFNPSTGMTALQTVKISRSSSTQRAGRAGRLRPGRCYRLWSGQQQQKLAEHSTAEILQADLAPLAMQLLQWGIEDPGDLAWIDPPPAGPWAQALDLLAALGAVERKQSVTVLTKHGEAMAGLPTHPRLAHMLIRGAESGHTDEAALLASALSERDPMTRENPDMAHRLDLLMGRSQPPRHLQGWLQRSRQLARQFEQQLAKIRIERRITALSAEQLPGYLVACAYPERIARQRHSGGYQLANGGSANLVGEYSLGRKRWLAVAEISGTSGTRQPGRGNLIRSAAELDESLFDNLLAEQVRQDSIVEWDHKAGRFIAEKRALIGELIWQREKLDKVPADSRRSSLIALIRKDGLHKLLNWSEAQDQWCARVRLLREHDDSQNWPDTSEAGLLETLADWLGPYLDPITTIQGFKKLNLESILQAMLSWEQQKRLEELVPPRMLVPSGSRHKIDYSQSPPVLAVKLQEMFGCETTPTVCAGRVALVVHLLSPAGRPLQVTQDLAGFWRSSYHDVKKDMKGRYPKHPWPEDPLVAIPTRRVKRRV